MIEYRGYTGVFEFDAELELFSGFVVDLRDQIYFEGDSVGQLKMSMHRAVDHYLQVNAARGEEPEKPFSGKLVVRLGTDLHRSVAVAAAVSGESINSWIVHALSSGVEEDRRDGHSSSRSVENRRGTRLGRPHNRGIGRSG